MSTVLPLARPNPLEPPGELARLRAEAPVHRVRSATGEQAWLVTRHQDARAVLGDRRFTLALPGIAGGESASNDSLFQDPPGHTRLRSLVTTAFTPRRVAHLRARTAEIATGLLTDMVSGARPADLMAALAFPLPIAVIGELLGIPAAEREGFRFWSNVLMSLPADGGAADPGEGWVRLAQQVGDLIADRRERPGDDLLSELVTDTESDRMSEPELVTMVITLIMAGYVTTSVAIGLGAILLTEHDRLAALADDPDLVATAVEEVLRFQAAGGDVARIAAEDLELAGVRISAGDRVIISITSANRDERRFTDPDRFDITRTDNPHLTFGHGIHHCLGAALARMELQVVFASLAARLPDLRLAVRTEDIAWARFELFGDEWPKALPVTWHSQQ